MAPGSMRAPGSVPVWSPTPASTPAIQAAAHPVSAGASVSATPSGPAPAATQTVNPADLPQAPGVPDAEFEVLTSTGGAPLPAVALDWYPAEAGDYMIKGYRVYRSPQGKGAFERREPAKGAPESLDLDWDDPAQLGLAYDYFVVAVDSLGREGAPSPRATVDLSKVPPEKLDPPAPLGLTATSRKDDVKLRWERAKDWIAPWSAYRIYRATSLAGLSKGHYRDVTASVLEALATPSVTTTATATQTPTAFGAAASSSWFGSSSSTPSQPSWLSSTASGTSGTAASATATAAAKAADAAMRLVAQAQKAVDDDNKEYFFFYDTATAKKVDYYYAVRTLDTAGRESPMGLTVLARATGPLPPGKPSDLTATAKTEQVLLRWEPAQEGTTPLSGYVLNRREIGSSYWRKVALLDVSATSYSDSLDGGFYDYRLAAFDAAGVTGTAAYIAASPSAKVLNNTLVITMPTAYADNPGRDTGLNLNVLFDFYVGSLFESYTSPITHQSQSSIFQQLEIGTMTGDFKYAWLNDRGWVPGFATGLYTTALIGFGSGSSDVGISSSGGGIDTLGSAYAVVSKRFWPSVPGAVVHLGFMHGDLAQDLTQAPIPSWAWPTIDHIFPGGAYPFLYSSFVDPALGQTIGQSPNLAYFGLQFPFHINFGSYVWRSGLRVEAMIPLAWEAQYPQNVVNTATESGNPANQLPYLINIHVDNLPLFGFEFGVFEFAGGYEVIAFYHIPDLTWAW